MLVCEKKKKSVELDAVKKLDMILYKVFADVILFDENFKNIAILILLRPMLLPKAFSTWH
jgi:hypothetical protein